MKEFDGMEFLVTVLAIVVGFVAGKLISVALAKAGVPIAAGDPIPVPLSVTTGVQE